MGFNLNDAAFLSSNKIIRNGLMGRWAMNEGTGILVKDSSGKNNNLILSGTPIPSWAPGKIGNAIQFGIGGATTNYIQVANQSWTDTVATICCWANAPWTTARYRTLFALNYTATTGIGLYTTGGPDLDWTTKSILAVGNGFNSGRAPRVYSSYGSITDNTWHHISATLGPNLLQIYLDGQLLTNGPNSAVGSVVSVTSQTLNIGSNVPTNDSGNQIQQDTRIYNRILTSSEIQQIYNFQG